MRAFFPAWFIGMIAVAGAHQILQKGFRIRLPVLDDYLDPLLAMPIILHLLLLEKRLLFRKGPSFCLRIYEIVFYTLLIAVLAEVIFPRLQPRFIADPVDAALYGIGAVWFYIYANKPLISGNALDLTGPEQ